MIYLYILAAAPLLFLLGCMFYMEFLREFFVGKGLVEVLKTIGGFLLFILMIVLGIWGIAGLVSSL